MHTKKFRANFISDIRSSVALLSLSGFWVFLIISSSLVLKFLELFANSGPVKLASMETAFSYFQVGCLVFGFLFAILGIRKVLRLQQFNMPKIQLSKFFSILFNIIGVFIGLLLILFFLPISSTNNNLETIEMYKTVRVCAKIFVVYTFIWYLVTLWLRKRRSVFSIGATTSFSLISLISFFPFGFIFLFVWLFFRGIEVSKFKEMMAIEQNE